MIAIVQASGRIVERFAVAGRYAPEFDGIGNDRAALTSLAQRTGGRVIEPQDRLPLPIRSLAAPQRLAPYLAAAGAFLVAIGLLAWWTKR